MDLERLFPADPVRPLWSTSSALVYAGGLVSLLATLGLIAIADDEGGAWALAGAAAVACAAAFSAAETLAKAERMIAAGVAAFLGVAFAGVVVGGVLDALGALDASLEGYQPAALLVEAALIAGGVAAARRYRTPFPLLLAALALWFAIADLGALASWDDAGEVLSLCAGVLLAAAGIAADRAGRSTFGFWPHVVGGAAAGGALVVLAGDSAWLLIAAVALGYVALAYVLERSSYAVLGALGLLIATTMFAVDPGALVGRFVPFETGRDGDALDGWQIALSYLVCGLVLAAIGVGGRLRRLPGSGPDPAGG